MIDRLVIGTVGRRFGVRGHFRVKAYSGEVSHLAGIRRLWMGPSLREVDVAEVLVRGDEALIKLKGVDSPEAAAGLVGQELWIDREHATPLGPDEYYVADLVGCRVEMEGGGEIGSVVAVAETTTGDLLETRFAGGQTVMVPFRADTVVEVDPESRRVVLARDLLLA